MAISQGVGPHFAWLSVGGQMFAIEHGTVEQNAQRESSKFSVQVPMNTPGALQTLATTDGSNVQVMVSTRGVTEPLITARINKCYFDYIGTSITAEGQCVSADLHDETSTEQFKNQTGSQIVKTVAGRVGIPVKADATMNQMAGKQLQQDWIKLTDGISVANLIHQLAQQDGARWWVDNHGTLNYTAIGSSSGTYTVNYKPPTPASPMRGDFMGMLITRNVQAGRPLDVSVLAWHPKKKQLFTGVANVSGIGQMLKFIYRAPTLDQQHADQYAQSRAKEIARQELEIDVDLVGDPTINVAQNLQVNGTGFFDTTYQMDTIKHHIGMDGHTMTINAKTAAGGRDSSIQGAPKNWWGADPQAPAATP